MRLEMEAVKEEKKGDKKGYIAVSTTDSLDFFLSQRFRRVL